MYSLSALGGIGTANMQNSFGTYKGYAAENHQKLFQALEARLGTDKAVSYTGVSKEEAASAETVGTAADARNFVQQYSKKMTDLKSTANEVLNSGNRNLAAISSDSKVLEGGVNWRTAASANYEIAVSQLATAQVNTSNGVDAAGANTVSSGQLQITGTKGSQVFEMDKYAGAKTNTEAMNALAADINKSGLNVTASTVTKDGKVSLQITAKNTGAENGFQVDGSFAVASGANQVTQAAQDAKYSVNGEEFTSASNRIQLDTFKVDVNLKSTGTATLKVGSDPEKTADQVQKMVDSYNGALKFLNDNYTKGSGVIRQMSNMLHLPVSDDSLKTIGVNVAKDGTLSLDRKTFLQSMNENPDTTKQILSGSYSLAQGLVNDANQGTSISSAKLTDGMQRQEPTERAAIRSQFGGYTYGYSGYATMLNYKSMGTLLNALI